MNKVVNHVKDKHNILNLLRKRKHVLHYLPYQNQRTKKQTQHASRSSWSLDKNIVSPQKHRTRVCMHSFGSGIYLNTTIRLYLSKQCTPG